MLRSPLLAPTDPVEGLMPVDRSHATALPLVHQLAESLGRAIDAKDSHTLAHSEEVAVIAQALAQSMGIGPRLADRIHVAGHLHDIGKIGVPDAILSKTGPLDAVEWERMRAHPDLGADILAPLACLRDCGIVAMVRAHHERFDGRGYPLGLAGRAIPIGARIITVADSLSAMLQSRPYRPARTFAAAAAEIARNAGSQFDPEVVAVFTAIAPQVRDMLLCLRGTPLPDDGATVFRHP